MPEPNPIGTLGEKSLHAALKTWYARPEDQFEVKVDGYIIDIVRDDLLIEIQTRNFSMIKRKLIRLTDSHPLRLVHPIAQDKWIVRMDGERQAILSRRKSPRRGSVYHIFNEMVRIPHLIAHANFSLEVLLTQQEEIRINDGLGSWRRKGWSIHDHKLLAVVGQVVLALPSDFRRLLPANLPQPFTNANLAAALKQPPRLAQKMTYCLRNMDVIQVTGKRGNAQLFEITD